MSKIKTLVDDIMKRLQASGLISKNTVLDSNEIQFEVTELDTAPPISRQLYEEESDTELAVKYGVYSPIPGLAPELSMIESVHDTREAAESCIREYFMQAPKVSHVIIEIKGL